VSNFLNRRKTKRGEGRGKEKHEKPKRKARPDEIVSRETRESRSGKQNIRINIDKVCEGTIVTAGRTGEGR